MCFIISQKMKIMLSFSLFFFFKYIFYFLIFFIKLCMKVVQCWWNVAACQADRFSPSSYPPIILKPFPVCRSWFQPSGRSAKKVCCFNIQLLSPNMSGKTFCITCAYWKWASFASGIFTAPQRAPICIYRESLRLIALSWTPPDFDSLKNV